MSRSRKKCWSKSVGFYGSRVRASELVPGGPLYLIWVDERRKQQKKALGHRDRKVAVEQALAHASATAGQHKATAPGTLTIGELFDIYERNGLHGRTEKHVAEVRRKLGLWRAFLGAQRPVHALSPADVERFVHARRSGTLRVEAGAVERAVSMTTIWHDYVALTTALHFGVRHREAHGRRLLTANPLDGVRVSKSVSPARPVADRAYYGALRGVGERISPKFSVALDLAFSTGHRIDAILNLHWNDISIISNPHAPHGTIRWRAENDKIENEHVVPMNQLAHDALATLARTSNAIGEAYVFPSETNDSKPVDRHLASRWLRRAERLAGLDHVTGRGWHSFRRAWASARKHLPDVDVAAAGGWKDTATMKRCYQHADAGGVLRAVVVGECAPIPVEVIQGVIQVEACEKGPDRTNALGAST